MYHTRSFERLAEHYDKLADHFHAAWTAHKKKITPSEGGGDYMEKIDGDPADQPRAKMMFKIRVRNQLAEKKVRGKDYDIECHEGDRTFKKWLRCPEFDPGMNEEEYLELKEWESKEFFDPSSKPVKEEARKYFKECVLNGRSPIDLNEEPREVPKKKKSKKKPKKGAKEKKPHLRISYQKLFNLTSEYRFLAALYGEDFSTLAALFPPATPADVIYHLTLIGNGISSDESRIIELLGIEKTGDKGNKTQNEKMYNRLVRIKGRLLEIGKSDLDKGVITIKRGEWSKQVGMNIVFPEKDTWFGILYYNNDHNGSEGDMTHPTEQAHREDVQDLLEKKYNKPIKIIRVN